MSKARVQAQVFGGLVVFALGVIVLSIWQLATTQSTVQPPQPAIKEVTATAPVPAPALPPTKEEIAARALEEKEAQRMAKMDLTTFCSKELALYRTRKGKLSPAWHGAAQFRANANGVLTVDITHIEERTVRIGMSPCAAMAAWGQPQKINATENSSGTREQWVYGGGGYLYFLQGALTSVQTSR